MDEPIHILTAFGACTIAVLISLWFLHRSSTSNIVATLPGPPSPSWVYGNMKQLQLAENYGDHEFQWQKQYGSLYRMKGCFGTDRLVVSDSQALRHILINPSFIRPPGNLKMQNLVFGEGSVFCVEGEEHRRLRAAMSAGFSGQGTRTFLPVFLDVADKMVNEWEHMCSPGSSIRLDVTKIVDHATLDIISEAALGLPVNSVQNPEHPLALTHLHVLPAAFIRSPSAFIAEYCIPYVPQFVLRLALHLPIGPLRALRSFKTVTGNLIEQRARDFETDAGDKCDLLSMIDAGRSGPGPRKTGITRSQLLQQLPLFLLAGQDTGAAVIAWALYWLAQNPEFQEDLREEILSNTSKSQEGYDSMPLLNALLKVKSFMRADFSGGTHPPKETLRMFPAAPLLERWTSEDIVLPLSSEIVTSTRAHIRELPVRKGQFIYIAVGAYQRLETLWGADAHEFKPSRWLAGDPCTGQALGPYAHLMAFFGGPRVCAGWRFAVLEMQVVVTELLGKFSFCLPEESDVRARLSATQFPVDSEGDKGLWLSVERVVN